MVGTSSPLKTQPSSDLKLQTLSQRKISLQCAGPTVQFDLEHSERIEKDNNFLKSELYMRSQTHTHTPTRVCVCVCVTVNNCIHILIIIKKFKTATRVGSNTQIHKYHGAERQMDMIPGVIKFLRESITFNSGIFVRHGKEGAIYGGPFSLLFCTYTKDSYKES